MEEPIVSLQEGSCTAEVYDTEMPGQFSVRYLGANGQVISEEALTGVSSYKQRETEIREHLAKLCSGDKPDAASLSDPGEY